MHQYPPLLHPSLSLPSQIRGTAMSSGSTAVWLFSFAVSYFFPGFVARDGG